MPRGLTRREVLEALLGLPVALAACKSRRPALPPGELVGASDVVGHRLRAGIAVTVPPDNWKRTGVAIVGAGVAGLSAAWRLLRSGFEDFVLLELEQAPGGTSRSGESPVVRYPWGAHYVPAPLKENHSLITLLDEMGILEGTDQSGQPVVAEQFLCREPEERVFYKGRWYEGLYLHAGASEDDRAQLDAFNAEVNRWVDWRDSRGRRAFAIPISQSSIDSEVTGLDKISVADWLGRRGFDSPRLRWWVDYACRDDYGMKAEDTSAWAGLFYFASRVPKGGQESQPLVTWPEGNGRLVSHLAQQIRDKLLVGLAAADINPSDAGVDVAALDYDGRTVVGFHAGQVVFAAPDFLKRYIIRPYRDDPPPGADEFHYSAWMVANLFLRNRPRTPGVPLAWDNVLYESESLGYVVATHQRGLDYGPTVFTYYYPLCDTDERAARTRLLDIGRDQWADVIMTDLRRAHPEIDSLVERIDVMRWGHAMIRPRTGFMWSDARTKASAPYRGIHFAHSDLSGIAIFEEAFYQGIRAAEEILSARGRLDRRYA
jgi:hypothetical protein